jgi:manganese transport protein
MKFLWDIFKSVIGAIFLLLIKIYQYFISPLTGASCRYTPTCSQYGVEAIRKHGAFKGGWLTIKRIAIIPLIHFTSDKKRMGNFATKLPLRILAWVFATLIVGLNVRLVIQEIETWAAASPGSANLVHYVISPIAVAVGLLLVYVFIRPILYKHTSQQIYVPHGIAEVLDNLDAVSYNQIGITIDFSKNDQDTIRHALMQGGKKAHYNLIHIVETAGARYYGKQVMDSETQSDVDNLDKYVSTLLKLGYKAEAKIGYGGPATSIAQIVKETKTDFLVMGSHGHKVFKDLIFGTTVDSVRHKVKVPVLVVKPQKK